MTLLLLVLGFLVAHRLLQGSFGLIVEILISLPIAALINVFAIAALTVFGISLGGVIIISANIGVTIIFLISIQPFIKVKSTFSSESNVIKVSKGLSILSVLILASSLFYSVSHTVLPTFHYDSTTNWNMRSKVSFYRAEIVLEDTDGLVQKAHYPFLYHAIQVTINQFSPNWSDKSANGIHVLLMFSCLGVVYYFLSRRGRSYALCCMALIVGVPLLTLHTGQSYADSTLVALALLSLTLFLEWRKENDPRLLLLSGVFIAACVWTKSDGLFFCFIPWMIMMSIVLVRLNGDIRPLRTPVLFTLLLSFTWPVFAIVKGLSLTPHGKGDTEVAASIEAVDAFSRSLFVSGSFGLYWYALLATLGCVFVGMRKGWLIYDQRSVISLLWGLIALAGYMGVYLLTSNTEYLILGQSFDRQMLLPMSLLTLSLCYMLQNRSV